MSIFLFIFQSNFFGMQLNTWKFFLSEKYFHLRIFYTRKTFYYICCIGCYVMASLLYLLYQLFCHGIFFNICCINRFIVASFIIFFVLVVLQWHYLLFSLRYPFCHSTLPPLSAYQKCLACTQSNLWHNLIGIIGQSQLPNPLLHRPEHSRTGLGPLTQKGPSNIYLLIWILKI